MLGGTLREQQRRYLHPDHQGQHGGQPIARRGAAAAGRPRGAARRRRRGRAPLHRTGARLNARTRTGSVLARCAPNPHASSRGGRSGRGARHRAFADRRPLREPRRHRRRGRRGRDRGPRGDRRHHRDRAGRRAAPERGRHDRRPGRPSLAWNGHLDTVPGRLARHLERRSVRRRGDRRPADRARRLRHEGADRGRARRGGGVRRAGIDGDGAITFHLAADEELAGIHGTKVLWERGLLTQQAAIVGEPSDLQLGLAERGGAWITATAHGKAAHGSQPDRGVNAITSMARYLLRLQRGASRRGAPAVRTTHGERGVDRGRQRAERRAGSLLDRHRSPAHPGRDRPGRRAGPLPRAGRRPPSRPPGGRRARRDPRVDRRGRGAARIRASPTRSVPRRAPNGARRRPTSASRASPTRASTSTRRDIPTAIFGPGSLSVAHTANEWVAVDDLVAAARIYARIFAGVLAG